MGFETTTTVVPPQETDALLPAMPEEDMDVERDVPSRSFQDLKQRPAVSSSRRQQAFDEVKEALWDHLQETAEDDNDFFLSMGLVKNLSLLPSKPEMVQSVEEVEEALGGRAHLVPDSLRLSVNTNTEIDDDEVDGHNGLPITTSTKSAVDHKKKLSTRSGGPPPLHAYITLGCAVVALSSIGPFLAKQHNVAGTLKIVWRFQGTAILLSPLFVRSLVVDGGVPRLSIWQWITFVCAAASYSVLCVAFALSINYTTVANATILTNSQSVLMVAGKLLIPSSQPVILIEVFGVIVAFLGGVLAAQEAAQNEAAPATGWLSLWGDALGIISSLGGMGYIILGKSLRSHIPVLMFMVLNMITASFIILIFMWCTNDKFTWDRNVNYGVFGWMNLQGDRLPLELATVFVCNVMGTMGYVRAFAYFSSVVIAVAALMEPVVAAFTAKFMGVGILPGFEGWVGNLLVILGTIAVMYPTTQQGQEEVAAISSSSRRPKTPRTPYPRMRTPNLQLSSRRRANKDGRLSDNIYDSTRGNGQERQKGAGKGRGFYAHSTSS